MKPRREFGMSAVMIYVTCQTEDEAREIASTLVGERLAACANILGAIGSFYWWEGAVEEGEEVALILKTKESLVGRLTERVKELHSYTVPCVVALPLTAGNPDFLRWIESETV
jgi:periplasmic divalent cation tolerance protein